MVIDHSPVARIERHGRFLVFEPPGPWLDQLYVTRLRGTRSRRYGSGVATDTIRLWRPVRLDSGRRAVQVWSGLMPIIRGSLAAAGYCVTKVGPVLSPMARIPETPSDVVTDSAFVEFIARQECGLIRYAPNQNHVHEQMVPARLVGQAAVAFPAAKIVVIVRTRNDAKEWRDVLRRFVTSVGVSTGRELYAGMHRVVVATPGASGMAGVEHADLVFLAAPLERVWNDPLLEVVSNEPPPPARGFRVNLMERLTRAGRARLFGFLPLHLRTSRFESARLVQLFGFNEITIPRCGTVERAVRVAWTKLTGGPAPNPSDTPLRVKELAVWLNPVANRRAACLARALGSGDSGRIRERFPDLADRLGDQQPRRILVLVESRTHAEELSRLLPGWPVLFGDQIDGSEYSEERGIIATATAVGRLRNEDFDVLVRLDAGVGLPPLPSHWLNTTDFNRCPLLVIDVLHRTHPLLRQWAKSRRAAYLFAGWDEIGVDPDLIALERFVALTSKRRRI